MERALPRLAFEIKHICVVSSSGDAQWCFPASNKCYQSLMAIISSPFFRDTVSVVFTLSVQADLLPLKWHRVLEWWWLSHRALTV